jgi:putative transposase
LGILLSLIMPIPKKYLADFEEHKIYHVFNRTNNKEKLFLSDENHRFFLKKYSEYLLPFSETIVWCLLSNHFHFLIRIKSLEIIKADLSSRDIEFLSASEKDFLKEGITLSELVERAFKRFFQSYALAFNKVHQRKGNLFYKPFKRLEITSESHFTQVIIYIHTNPSKHRFTSDFSTWRWSSYQDILRNSETPLHSAIINWFGGIDQFIKLHKEALIRYEQDFAIED